MTDNFSCMPDFTAKSHNGVIPFITAKESIMTPPFVTFCESMGYTVIHKDMDSSLVYPFIIENCTAEDFKLLLDMSKG